jgi:hypothetical protein
MTNIREYIESDVLESNNTSSLWHIKAKFQDGTIWTFDGWIEHGQPIPEGLKFWKRFSKDGE